MIDDLITNKQVALFTGCFHNYYYPEVGIAMVKVLEHSGVEVIVPDQVCCGLPMIAKGNSKGANKAIAYNVKVLNQAVSNGYIILTTCSSCSLFLKRNYRLYGNEAATIVAQFTYHFSEYLLRLNGIGQLNTDFRYMPQTVFYQTPCHLIAADIGQPTIELLRLIPGITIEHVSEQCCGMGGAYGYEKVNYRLAQEIGSKLFEDIKDTPTDRVMTDCGGCKLQIEAGCGVTVEHPIMLLYEAYNLSP